MLPGMRTTERLTITVPGELAQRARQAVQEGRAESVSGYVADALERAANLEHYHRLEGRRLAESGVPDVDTFVKALRTLSDMPDNEIVVEAREMHKRQCAIRDAYIHKYGMPGTAA
jgi:Arc/MetJ-type ribon-helix-helix transcriptional regulator